MNERKGGAGGAGQRVLTVSLPSFSRIQCPIPDHQVFPERGRARCGGGKGNPWFKHGRGKLKAHRAEGADSGQDKSSPEAQGASQWAGHAGQRKGREKLWGKQPERRQLRQETSYRQGQGGRGAQREGGGSGCCRMSLWGRNGFCKSDLILRGLRTPG